MVGCKDIPLDVRPPLYLFSRRILTFNSVVEINTGLICSCTPVLKPFFKRVFAKTRPDPYEKPADSLASSIWMGKNPDDQSHGNYRNIIELERGKSISHEDFVHEVKN